MEELKNYEDCYKPLWLEFFNNIKGIDVKDCPEPHLPIYGENYNSFKYKIAFVGIDTVGSCNMDKYNSEDGYRKIIQEWKDEFDELDYCYWAWKWNFWRFIFQFLGKFYNLDLEEIKKCESEEVQNILKSFVWANTMSIERYQITAEGKNVKYDNWKKVKDASIVFDKAENILEIYKPNILVLLNWNAPDEWFPDEIGEPEKLDPNFLWYYYIEKSDTHLYWTKHPRSLTKIGFDVIIYKILQSIITKNVFQSFPGQIRFELIEKFECQMKEIATELELQIDLGDNLGQVDSYFCFYKQKWSIGIGFGFDKTWARDFFGGICIRNSDTVLPEKTLKEIQGKLEMNQIPTPNWPYWFWFDEHKDWNQKTFDEIKSGELKKKIKVKVEDIMKKIEVEEVTL